MNKRLFALVLLSVIGFAGCDLGQYEWVSKAEMRQLREEAVFKRHVGRYREYRSGGNRTWRLDTITGDYCLMLAPNDDWKTPDIKAQNCRN